MKIRRLHLRLFPVMVVAPIAAAQNPSVSAAVSEEALKFLSAPVWYLNYTVKEKLRRTGGPDQFYSERLITGRMKLGLRSQGPSLSAQQAARLQFDEFMFNYANWLSGVNIDETKSDEENERLMVKTRMDNIEAFERHGWDSSGPSHAGGYNRASASGTGTVLYGDEPAFEIDGGRRKFKLLFPLKFRDSPQTQESMRGRDEFSIGTIHHKLTEIKTGLHSGEQPITQITPTARIIEGVLPGSFGNISGQEVYSIVKGGLPGTLSIDYVISPFSPIPVEMIIEPPAEYLRWQPLGDKDERTAGDTLPIKVVLQKPGGGTPQFKPRRITYQLWKTSREKGVCMNWPPNPDNNLPYDLQFEQRENPELLGIDLHGQIAVNSTPAGFTDMVIVSSFDYGAHGELTARAELENGQIVDGVVKFTADQKELKLPFRPDGSIIASAFFDHHGLSGVSDDDDTERDPVGDGFTGDGLTLYEEYRGFMVGENWTPGDPKKKEVFVVNELRGLPSTGIGIQLFAGVTKFKVHQLWDNQVNADGQINSSRTAGPHVVDQHAIRIQAGELGLLGNNAAQVTGDVGTPGTAKTVSMPPDLGTRFSLVYMASTLAHEMLHSCNVYHHGECDTVVWWSYDPGSGQMYESGVAEDAVTGNLVSAGNRVPITVMTEAGAVVDPVLFFRKGITGGPITLALAHGQHSGADTCIMRYDNAEAYKSRSDVFGRYLSGREATGYALCTSRAGTGVNEDGRTTPQPRYFSAATPQNGGPHVRKERGDCVHQLRVNDLATEPKR